MKLLFSEEWGRTTQDAVAETLDELRDNEERETPSGEPFCGCHTCEERELLYLATLLGVLGYISGEVRLALEDDE